MFSLSKKKIVMLISATIIVSSILGTVIVAQGKKWNPLEDLWNAIFGLNQEVEDLQTQINEINEIPVGYTKPAFDSGWVEMKFPGDANVFTHGLGTTDVIIHVMMREPDGYINAKPTHIYWDFLTPNEVTAFVRIFPNAVLGYYGDVRIMLWKIAEP